MSIMITAYLFRRSRMRSGVLASDTTRLGALDLISAAMLFSDAAGRSVAPPDGAPGWVDGSLMLDASLLLFDAIPRVDENE